MPLLPDFMLDTKLRLWYYVNFPFIHESWIKKGDVFNYILTQDTELPNDFYFFKLVYENKKTHVNLYSGEGFWKY